MERSGQEIPVLPLLRLSHERISQHRRKTVIRARPQRTFRSVFSKNTLRTKNPTNEGFLCELALLRQKAASLGSEVLERKKKDREPRRKEMELTTYLQTSSTGIHWAGPDKIIQWANPAEMALLSCSPEEYIGHHISEFHADKSVIDDIFARLTRGETLHDFPARLKCGNGDIKSVLIDSNVLWEDGHFIHTQCFTRDVTDKNRAEAAGRLLAAIVESSDDAIISKDLNSIITSWNKGAERIFGYSAEEIIGKSVTLLIPQDHHDEEPTVIARILRGEHIDHYETVRQRRDGSLIDISLIVSPIRNGGGRIVGASKLAIVRKAVERMGGSVGVESDGKSGSRFWIRLKAFDDSL
jgi:PAS domain S-box-containing protein